VELTEGWLEVQIANAERVDSRLYPTEPPTSFLWPGRSKRRSRYTRNGPFKENQCEGRAVAEVEIEVRVARRVPGQGSGRVVDADGNVYDVSQKLIREADGVWRNRPPRR
jgi:hypothetical protein